MASSCPHPFCIIIPWIRADPLIAEFIVYRFADRLYPLSDFATLEFSNEEIFDRDKHFCGKWQVEFDRRVWNKFYLGSESFP